jgi:hypothetical protein
LKAAQFFTPTILMNSLPSQARSFAADQIAVSRDRLRKTGREWICIGKVFEETEARKWQNN